MNNNNLRQHAALLDALSDANRLRLLKCLQVRPLCVCELVQATGLPQSRISRHLKVLRDVGLVSDARDAQWVEYSLVEVPPGDPRGGALSLLAAWLADDPVVLADRQALATATRRAPVTCREEGGGLDDL